MVYYITVNPKGNIKGFIWFSIGLALIVGVLFLFVDRQEFSSGVSASLPTSFGVGTPTESVGAASVAPKQIAVPDQTYSSVQIAATEIPVEIATSSAAVQKGLSGRVSLAADRGMLFLFDRPEKYRFWMPDMRFPIDIIWIDDNQVIDVDENVSPKFDPLHPIFYTPARPVRYVLEVNAGFMKRNNIHIGDAVIFNRIR